MNFIELEIEVDNEYDEQTRKVLINFDKVIRIDERKRKFGTPRSVADIIMFGVRNNNVVTYHGTYKELKDRLVSEGIIC